MSRVQRLQWVSAALLAGVLLLAGVAQAQQYFTLTSHVPPAVANGQAAWLDEFRSTQRLSLAISLPLRNETELDDLLQRLYDPESPLRSGSLGFRITLMSAVLFTCWFFSSAASSLVTHWLAMLPRLKYAEMLLPACPVIFNTGDFGLASSGASLKLPGFGPTRGTTSYWKGLPTFTV
jgi:hypothetical protein